MRALPFVRHRVARRKPIASPALVYMLGQLCRLLFRGKSEPMLSGRYLETERLKYRPHASV